jgi:hypothetical protein
MSRQRPAHSFAQARRGATEGGSGRSPYSRMRVRSPMGVNRALVAKCALDGFRESLARFRADRAQRNSGQRASEGP